MPILVTERGVLALENPRREDVGDALFELLLIVHAAQRDGTWKWLLTALQSLAAVAAAATAPIAISVLIFICAP